MPIQKSTDDDIIDFEVVVDPDIATPDESHALDAPGGGEFHALGAGPVRAFRYIGRGLTLDQFAAYVQGFDFGPYPPTFVVLHHTSVPDASWGKLKAGSWDAGEAGLSTEQVYAKRLRQLDAIRRYYDQTMGWDRGPHLFIDDRWVWLFSPMDAPGIHARTGNGTSRSYSIGIEVVGHFAKSKWPRPVETLVGGAVATLQRKLGTFQLEHRHMAGGVSSHREYGKPACPGDAITNAYYLGVIQREAKKLAPPCAGSYRCTVNSLRIRQAPNTVSPIAGTLSFGQVVQIDVIKPNEELVIDTRDWGHLADERGFVSMRYMRKVDP